MDSYVILDLETTGFSTSYCEIIEIGAIKIMDGEIVDKFSSLINPQKSIKQPQKSGITNKMVIGAPTIDEILPEFLEFVKDFVIVGQNITFDLRFLSAACKKYLGFDFNTDYIDMLQISRIFISDIENYKLSTLVKYFGTAEETEHRALSDCIEENKVYGKMISLYEITPDYYIKSFVSNTTYNTKNTYKNDFSYYYTSININEFLSDITASDETHPFFKKVCVFTGNLCAMSRNVAQQIVAHIGGNNDKTLTKRTNYLIVGDLKKIQNKKSNKIKKAEEYMLNGQDLKIMDEFAFYELVGIPKEKIEKIKINFD